MTKKRVRAVYSRRKRKVSKPRSNDSGVSLKCTHDIEKNLDLNDSKEATNKNLKHLQDVQNTVERTDVTTVDQQLHLAVDRPELAFIEDENCLDYEPSDDEVDTHSYAASHKKCIPSDCEGSEIDNNGNVLPTVDLNTQRINDCELSNNVSFSHDLYHSSAESNNAGETCSYYDESVVMENDSRNEEIFEEDLNSEEEESTLYNENELSHEDEPDSVNNLFGNAKVHFNGPLNITITRSVLNNTTSKIPQICNGMTPNLNVSPVADSHTNVRIINMSTLMPEKKPDIENNCEKKNSNSISPINCSRITLHDDIFSHNVDQDGKLDKINSNLLCEEEMNSEQTRASITVSTDLLNREEYQLQENDKEAFVAQWLMHNNEDYFSELLNSLCESHFTKVCNNIRCSKTHTLDEIKKMIHRSSSQEFEEHYKKTLKKDLWFIWLFDVFLDCFTVIPNRSEMMLIDMINDVYNVFNNTLTDKTSYIVKIIQSLRKIGISFKQAIKRIILRYGTTKLWICDILLFIIAAEPNLEDHWCLVQRITSCRKEKIDHKVVTEVLNASLNKSPPNEELCKRIYQDIFEKNLTDVAKIPSHLIKLMAKVTGNFIETQGRIPSPVSMTSSGNVIFHPINPISSSLQTETLRSNENMSHLPDQVFNQVMTENSSDFNASNEMVHVTDGDFSNNQVILRHNEITTHKNEIYKKQSRIYTKLRRNKLQQPSTSRLSRKVSNRVLKNVIKSLTATSEPQTPANMIAHPLFQPRIDPLYQCNVSLHNILPKVQCVLTDITSTDVQRLKNSLRDEDTNEFMDLLQSYSDLYSIENFIVNVFTLLKSVSSSSVIYSIFMSLLNALDKMDEEIYLKATMEVLALNFIYMFNSKGHYSLSRNILLKVKDWHSLVTSKVFLGKSNLKSHMGRYIYIIKTLIHTEDFSWANEIFQAEALTLLGPTSSWPYKYEPSDTQGRNRVLGTFLEKCFDHNIFIANDLLKHIVVVYGGLVDGFELWTWFDNKILSLMKAHRSKISILLLLYNDISNYYETYMNKYILQSYMLHMVNNVTSEMAFELFKKCCDKGIYNKYTGEERIVHVKTNYTDFEITSLLQCYLENFQIGRVSSHDFYIDLILPEMDVLESTMTETYRTNRPVYKVFEIVCNILDSKFGIKIDQPVLYRIFVSLSN